MVQDDGLVILEGVRCEGFCPGSPTDGMGLEVFDSVYRDVVTNGADVVD